MLRVGKEQHERAKGLTPEREPFPHYPVIILGGASGTGKFFTRILARKGYAVFVGTRNEEKFHALGETVSNDGGISPLPFIADITKPNDLHHAYEEMGLEKGAPAHYFPLAAAGYESLKPVMELLVQLRRAHRQGALTDEFLTDLTDRMKGEVTKPAALELANQTNRDALLSFAGILQANGHLKERSVIGTLSSTISDYTDPDNPEGFPGPWLYYPIGISKAQGVQGLRDIAKSTGASHIDFVAPEIEGTGVGDFFGKLNPIFEAINELSGEPFNPPVVTRNEVATAMFRESTAATTTEEKIRKVYIQSGGFTSSNRPVGWEKPPISYL